ncbi:aminotransferase class I/II-fold pyridoxal phosphate-dependent enzyme [Fodinicurvata sp. EGI_FJ10296]|uniref:aminotransferase class I/II-fold pyridoxal phosphate-dependent enzyme n=1 Tax=Fodinicurvata sp. EGI_FJ10296 TaxID=3231908 RepID=UPI0034569100
MLNTRLDQLDSYPFARLRTLLDPIAPPTGIEPVWLSVGEPKHTPPAFVEAILRANAADWTRYPPKDGTADFRDACCGWLDRRFPGAAGRFGTDCVLPVSGTREGLFMAALLAVDDTGPRGKPPLAAPLAAMPNPAYAPYEAAAVMAGAQPVFLPSLAENGFVPDVSSLDAATLDRLSVYYLCSPTNPEGALIPADTLDRAIRLAVAHDFVLIVDECYIDLYSGDTPPPGALERVAALSGELPQAAEHVLVFQSLSKRSNIAGMRSGFVAGGKDIISRFDRLRSYASAGMPLPVQAVSAALWRDDGHAAENRRLYADKVRLAEDLFGQTGPRAGFFYWLDVTRFGLDGVTATKLLWEQTGVRVLPGAYLAHDDAEGRNPAAARIRLALVHPMETLAPALERAAACLKAAKAPGRMVAEGVAADGG